VQSGADLVERGAIGWSMADQHQRVERGKRLQPFGQLRFRVFARRVERRGVGIAQSGDVPFAHHEVLPVEVVQAMALAHGGHLAGRFVIPRQHPALPQVIWSPAAM